MKGKILVVDLMHDSILPMIESIGFEGHYHPGYTRADILREIEAYEGLIIRSKTDVDKELIDRAVNLKFVGRAGAGIDKLDIKFLEEKGIKVLNAPEGNRDALAEHGIGMVLSILNRISCSDEEVRENIWKREENRGYELGGKTVGIYGYGYMGSALGERLPAFGCRVLAYDKYKTNYVRIGGVEEVDLEYFKENTEILSIHVPLSQETRNMFDYEYFRSFPNLFAVINTARGEVLVLEALVRLLEENRIWGAALDVLENEQLKKLTPQQKLTLNKLKSFKNVLFTPHVGGWSHESYRRINKVLIEKISNLKL